MNGLKKFDGGDEERKYIGYHGYWYDVTNFTRYHPGGDVIERFVGQDATHVIDTAHRQNVLLKRKPVSTQVQNGKNGTQLSENSYKPSQFGRQMLALHEKLKQEGFYDNSIGWYVRKFLLVIGVQLLILILMIKFGESSAIQCLCGFLLAGFWQQSGMLMHDLMHSQAWQNRKIDELFGVYFGTLCFGISSRWWKGEHIEHHALTNTVDYKSGFIDPQADEESWAQNEKLFPFKTGRTQAFLIKIQYITFLPLCMFAGRVAIILDSMRAERRKDVWLAFALHWAWVIYLLSFLPNWRTRILFYFGASIGEGVLHIQLLMNHYSKPFFEKSEMHNTGFFRAMVDANINIVCPVWMDWFHGGLNFHIEHHCFPRLPRNRLREVSPMIKKICKENDILYDECSFLTALKRTLSHLKSVSQLYETMKGF